MTRRQASTVSWSPRSLAASRTIQAASRGLSDCDASEALPGRLRAPNEIPFMADHPHPVSGRHSLHRQRGLPLGAGIGIPGMLARLVEFQHAAGCLEIEAAKFAFLVFQFLGGDAVILGAEKQ